MDSQTGASNKKRISIVTPDIAGPIRNGGVGTSCANLAFFLAENRAYDVEILFASAGLGEKPGEWSKWVRFYRQRGIALRGLQQSKVEVRAHYWAMVSHLVYQDLITHPRDLLIFPDMFGVSYYTVLAKKLGLHFHRTQILTQFLGPQVWSRHFNGERFCGPEEVMLPMFERLGIEYSDHVQFATEWSRNWCLEQRWAFPTSTTCLFPFTRPPDLKRNCSYTPPAEIVFFGRLEDRKGLSVFLNAVDLLVAKGQFPYQKITFLGREGSPDTIRKLKRFADRWRRERPNGSRNSIIVQMKTGLQSDEAIAYLKSQSCLAAVLSQSETMGYTLLECLAHGIPVIASRIEPFERLVGKEGYESLVDPLSVEDVANALSKKQGLLLPGRAVELWEETTTAWSALVEKLTSLAQEAQTPPEAAPPTVSVCIVHYRRPNYLIEALDSLLSGTCLPEEVLVYDNDSRDPNLHALVREYDKRFSLMGVHFSVVFGESNRGPSYGRNRLAELAASEFLLFMDDDNRAMPREIELLKRAQAVSSADVISVPLQKFVDGQEGLWMNRLWIPLGFDRAVSVFENGMGDTNSLMRRSMFLTCGGFIDRPDFKAEDFHLLSKLVRMGAKAYVCPEPLVEYRIHPSNRSQTRNPIERSFHSAQALNASNGEHTYSPDRDLTVVADILSVMAERQGFTWDKEPLLWPRSVSKAEKGNSFFFQEILPFAVEGAEIETFGLGHRISSFRKRRSLAADVVSQLAFRMAFPVVAIAMKKELGPGWLLLTLVLEEPAQMTCGNPYVELSLPSGISSLQIPLSESMAYSNFSIQFAGVSRVFVRQVGMILLDDRSTCLAK